MQDCCDTDNCNFQSAAVTTTPSGAAANSFPFALELVCGIFVLLSLQYASAERFDFLL